MSIISGIPMVGVLRYDRRNIVRTSLTPITNGQYSPVLQHHYDQGARYARLVRGLNGRTSTVLYDKNAAGQACGKNRVQQADQENRIVALGDSTFLCKLVPEPSPKGWKKEWPVVDVTSVEADVWCELSGGEFQLPPREQMIFTLTGGGTHQFPTANGKLFDDRGNRLLHGSLKMKDGQVCGAPEGDPESECFPCDVNEREEDGYLRVHSKITSHFALSWMQGVVPLRQHFV